MKSDTILRVPTVGIKNLCGCFNYGYRGHQTLALKYRSIKPQKRNAVELFYETLRREILLFDKILIEEDDLNHFLQFKNPGMKRLFNDIEYLCNRNLIETFVYDNYVDKLKADLADPKVARFVKYCLNIKGPWPSDATFEMEFHPIETSRLIDSVRKRQDQIQINERALGLLLFNSHKNSMGLPEMEHTEVKTFEKLKTLGVKPAINFYYKYATDTFDIQTRIHAQVLKKKFGSPIIPIIHGIECYNALSEEIKGDQILDYEDSYNIILGGIPAPTSRLPLKELIEYRNSTENRTDFVTLRKWMRSMVEKRKSKNELTEEIEYLFMQRMKYLKQMKIERNQVMLEAVLVGSVGFAENIIRCKFGKALESFVSVNKQRRALLESERSAPGDEIAYIYNIHHNL